MYKYMWLTKNEGRTATLCKTRVGDRAGWPAAKHTVPIHSTPAMLLVGFVDRPNYES